MTMTDNGALTYPEPADPGMEGHRNAHPDTLDRLRAWAEDATCGTLDPDYEVAKRYLISTNRWPDDFCGSTEEGRQFLVAVLQYKDAQQAALSTPANLAAELLADPEPTVGIMDAPALVELREAHRLQLSAKDDQIASLERQVQSLNAQVERVRSYGRGRDDLIVQLRQRHDEDVEKIGQWLINEATTRRWCPDYDRLIETLNGDLHVQLPLRTREFEVTWTDTYTVRVSRSTTVEATSMEDAEEMAQNEDRDTPDWISRYSDDYNFEDSDNFEVNEN